MFGPFEAFVLLVTMLSGPLAAIYLTLALRRNARGD